MSEGERKRNLTHTNRPQRARKEPIMAKNLSITRAEVLTAVVNGDYETLAREDAKECAAKMLASITKPREKSNEPSKAAKENIRLAAEVLEVMPADEPVLTSWIMNHVNGIMTSQKCTKVMEVLIKAGRVERVEKVKGRYIGYKLV